MPRTFWLVKQEPADYAWAEFVKEGRTAWTGVRNFQARNNLRAMKPGDLAFYYHSGDDKQIVGVARIVRAAYPDPTATEGDWSAVELVPLKPVTRPLALADLKADAALKNMAFVRQSRLSVSPVTADEAARLLALAEPKL
jgi:predicted RNA-binding protein with PUA-like domain